MRLRCFLALAAVTLSAACLAQGDKPWEKQGTKAGDEITGPDGGKMVWVPAGEFDMGSNDGEEDEKPVHHVRITRGFWLGKCTVTNAQYRRYCQEAGVKFAAESDQDDDHPVVCVTWQEAEAYCKHYGLALPTEAQWEYAARGPGDRIYPWGNVWDPKKCANSDTAGPGGAGTLAVGTFPAGASWCGAMDMAGDACQWCADWFDRGYYGRSPDADPLGPVRGGQVEINAAPGIYWHPGPCRAVRGASCLFSGDSPGAFRASGRDYFEPSCRVYPFGFRCLKSP